MNKKIEKIYNVLKEIVRERMKRKETGKRGRPRIYKEIDIIIGGIVMEIYKISLRKLEEVMKESKGIEADYTTYYKRIKRLNIKELREIIYKIRKKIGERVKEIKEEMLMVDGTGIMYKEKIKVKYKLGEEEKEVNNHIKVVSVIRVGKDREGKEQGIIEEIEVGKGYSDEGKLLKEIIKRGRIEGEYMLGDGYYGRHGEIIRLLKERGIKLISPVKESMYKEIRNKDIKEVKERYEKLREVYKGRYKIEQVFGIIKRRYLGYINTKIKEIAMNRTLIKFLAYNLSLLIFNFYLNIRLTNNLKFNLNLSFV